MTLTATEPATRDDVAADAVRVSDRADAVPDGAQSGTDDLVLADLLVEEISIDGMCGVY
jgi:mycofactocin precursor